MIVSLVNVARFPYGYVGICLFDLIYSVLRTFRVYLTISKGPNKRSVLKETKEKICTKIRSALKKKNANS